MTHGVASRFAMPPPTTKITAHIFLNFFLFFLSSIKGAGLRLTLHAWLGYGLSVSKGRVTSNSCLIAAPVMISTCTIFL